MPLGKLVYGYATGARKDRRDDFRVILDEQKSQLADLRRENHELKLRVMHLESTREDMPYPMWSKDRAGRYQWVNPAFEQELLVPIELKIADVLGKKDEEIWPEELDPKLGMLVRQATAAPDRRAYCEDVRLGKNYGWHYTVFKFPLFRGSLQTGWMASAFPELDMETPRPTLDKIIQPPTPSLPSPLSGIPGPPATTYPVTPD
jgi:PAS domain-containing protein